MDLKSAPTYSMYTYSLVVDGNIIDTKKMVKSE